MNAQGKLLKIFQAQESLFNATGTIARIDLEFIFFQCLHAYNHRNYAYFKDIQQLKRPAEQLSYVA